jgi:hypothetical protein
MDSTMQIPLRDCAMKPWSLPLQGSLVKLLIINLLLQAFDGFASYHIISAGVPEENPVVASFIANWGVMGGLLFSKSLGCALVVLVFMLGKRVHLVATRGLTILAYLYSCLAVFLVVKLLEVFT